MHNQSIESIFCPICQKNELLEISEKGQFGHSCHVKICKNDGMVFLSPRWKKEKYDSFYESEFDKYYRPHVFDEEKYSDKKYKRIIEIFKRIDDHINFKGGSSVLDVGAGMGYSLNWIQNTRTEFDSFFAIEPSEHCREKMSVGGSIGVLSDDIDSEWQSPPIDLVVLRHVLEHLLNPKEALLKLASALQEDGYVYISVPDMMHPRGSLENYWFRIVHTLYFNKNTLLEMCRQAGLLPVAMGEENSEIWGIFKKAQTGKKETQNNTKSGQETYAKQLAIIREYKEPK